MKVCVGPKMQSSWWSSPTVT